MSGLPIIAFCCRGSALVWPFARRAPVAWHDSLQLLIPPNSMYGDHWGSNVFRRLSWRIREDQSTALHA